MLYYVLGFLIFKKFHYKGHYVNIIAVNILPSEKFYINFIVGKTELDIAAYKKACPDEAG